MEIKNCQYLLVLVGLSNYYVGNTNAFNSYVTISNTYDVYEMDPEYIIDLSKVNVDDNNVPHLSIDMKILKDLDKDVMCTVAILQKDKKTGTYRSSLIANFKDIPCCSVLEKKNILVKNHASQLHLEEKCPISAGHYKSEHFVMVTDGLPPFIPPNDYKIEMHLLSPTNSTILKSVQELTLKMNLKLG